MTLVKKVEKVETVERVGGEEDDLLFTSPRSVRDHVSQPVFFNGKVRLGSQRDFLSLYSLVIALILRQILSETT